MPDTHTMRSRTRRAAALAALLGAALCAAPAAAQVLVPDGFTDRLVLPGLDYPVGIAWLPDGRLLMVEQKTARVRLVVNGALAATDPVATIDNVRTQGGEQGLLGIAVDPGWPARPYIYVHCDNQGTSSIRISRYTVTGDLAFTGNGALAIDTATRYDLINDIPDQAPNHNGGTLRFGTDGRLYGSFGEDAQPCLAQTRGLRGVILRLDVSRLPPGPGGPPPRALIVPPGNPFPATPDSNALLVWAYGLRNPFRFHVDPADGALFIADVGENSREEIDRAAAGGLNFGWPRYEGFIDGSSDCLAPGATATAPIADYTHAEGNAVVSGGVYRRPGGSTTGFPAAYEGDYFFSDYYTGFLRRLKRSGNNWAVAPAVPGQPSAANWASGMQHVSDYLVGPDGALWYCRQSINFAPGSGQIRRIESSAGPDTTPGGAPGGVDFARPFPLPAVGGVNLRYTLTRAALVSMHVYDMRGARIRTLVPQRTQDADTYDVLWQGIDDAGEAVPAGVYYVRLLVDGEAMSRTVPLLR